MANPERPFFGRVESLRGLGALAVALVHVGLYTWHGYPLLPTITNSAPLARIFTRAEVHLIPGHAALMLFFVISGFVLRLLLEHGPQNPWTATHHFVVKRVWRVFPIVWFALLLTACVDGPHCASPATWLANALLWDCSLNPTFWALQVEVVMVPAILLLYFAERRWSARLLVAVVVVLSVLSFVKHWALTPGLSGHAFAVLLGMTIPTYGRHLVVTLQRRALYPILGVALLLLEFVSPLCGLYSPWTRLAEGYAAWFLLSAVAYRPDIRGFAWLDARPLRMFGRISGSFYVLHMLFAHTFFALLKPDDLPALPQLGNWVLFVYLSSLTTFAWLSYTFIEAPSIALGKRLLMRQTTGRLRVAPVS